MIVDMISDLHGHYPKLEGGDLLIVAGDLTARDESYQYLEFNNWLNCQEYKKKIVIGGNHDNCLQSGIPVFTNTLETRMMIPVYGLDITYLCDSGTEFEGLKIWGSPWSLWFHGINPNCKAFTASENKLKKKFDLIPDDVDILITHSPPHGILDLCESGHVGSKSLRRIMGRVKPKLWVCGHIHEGYGEFKDTTISGIDYHIINASIMNDHYEPVNKPVRVIL